MGTIQVLDTGLEGIEVILVALYRSVFWGSLATLPCVVAVTANLAMMGWLGIPLGVATSMFAAVALGIGDSFSIHLIERYRFALARGQEPAAALGQALRVVGPASSVDAMTVVAGLGILTLSQVPANARLGMMSVVTIASCFLTTLIVLPPLISASGSAPRFAPTAQE